MFGTSRRAGRVCFVYLHDLEVGVDCTYYWIALSLIMMHKCYRRGIQQHGAEFAGFFILGGVNHEQ